MKRKVLSLLEKSEIIKSLDNGETVTNVSKKYGIAKSTVCAIRNRKQKIVKAVTQSCGVLKKKNLKPSKMPKMERRLFKWFCLQRLNHVPVSSAMVKEKAKILNEKFQENFNFTASDGWLTKFKRRFGVRFLKTSGEKLSAAHQDVHPFKTQLQEKIKEFKLTNDQIYNADESGLFWKLLPDKTLVMSNEKSAPGRKADKVRITFRACTNATGEHKIKPLIIGRAKNPRCFKNVSLPVEYRNSKNAWMTSSIFENWFHYSFVPEVRKFLRKKKLEQKAMLLLDNAPSHPPSPNLISDDGKIFVEYMGFDPTNGSKCYKID
jgi:hypothetical protein